MPQNIYDTPGFFTNYSKLLRSREGLQGAPEWPRLQSFFPDLGGARVLDLGCGFGWYSRWMHDHGAVEVRAVDLSENMLGQARLMTDAGQYRGVMFERADLDGSDAQLQQLLPGAGNNTLDVVFSALALHYLENLPRLVAHVHRVLRAGGVFVFSVEHPIFTAPSAPGVVEIPAPPRSGTHTVAAPQTRRVWPLDSYQSEGLRVTNWLADGVRKQHRTVATYVNMLLDAGFELTGFNEWYPTSAELE
ncbi:S-adenosyl-L-methionine-dependent methyltransferase, partial [Lasiosphaeria miniovina]